MKRKVLLHATTLLAFYALFILSAGQLAKAQPYPTSSYELSADGKTLIKWKGTETIINMKDDPTLNKVEVIQKGSGTGAFYLNENITKVVLPTSLITCDYGAISECSNLKEIDASHCTQLQTLYANYNYALTDVKLPTNNTLQTLDLRFSNKIKPFSVTHLTNLTELRFDASKFTEPMDLSQNTKLENLKIGGYQGTKMFDFTHNTQLKSLELSYFYTLETFSAPYLTELTEVCFQGSPKLKSVDLSKNLKLTGENGGYSYAFNSCTALKEVKLPSTLTKIEHYAFSGCTALSPFDLTHYSKLTDISNNAFEEINTVKLPSSVKTFLPLGCENLYWYCRAPLAPKEYDGKKPHFKKLYIPYGTTKAYKDAGWESCTDQIIEMEVKFYALTTQVVGKGTLVIKKDDKALNAEELKQIKEGTTLTVEATPATGYKLTALTIDGKAVNSGDAFTLEANTTVVATFTKETANEAIEHNGVSAKRLQADRLTLELPAPAHYELFTITGERILTAYKSGRVEIPINANMRYILRVTTQNGNIRIFKL